MPALFEMIRESDETGVSGTGIVAKGVWFEDDTTVIHWTGEIKSTTIYTSIHHVYQIHGHVGKTQFRWLSREEHIEGGLLAAHAWDHLIG